MTRAGPVVLLLAFTFLGCGRAPLDATSGEPTDVAGRGLQPPWWEAMPLTAVADPVEEAPRVRGPAAEDPPAVPQDGLVIPGDILFDHGRADVRPADADLLHDFAARLAAQLDATEGTWTVVGATDSTGQPEDNTTLGRDRAAAVVEVLVSAGLPADRFTVDSWGESRPAVDEVTAADPAEARARNRRVVILPPA